MLAACRNQCQRGFPGWRKSFFGRVAGV